MEINILIVLCLLSLIMSIFGLLLGGYALIKTIAVEKSTHSVHFQPIDETLKEQMKDWGTSEESLNKQAKLYKEEVEEQLPEFADTEEDIKIHSF
jgi:hypothetical protein